MRFYSENLTEQAKLHHGIFHGFKIDGLLAMVMNPATNRLISEKYVLLACTPCGYQNQAPNKDEGE